MWLVSAVAMAQAPDEVGETDADEEIVVTASRSPSQRGDHPVAVEVVDRDEIDASGAETLAEVLQEQPGVQIDREVTGVAVRLQGLDPEHTLVLVDGQRVVGRKDGVIDLSRIALDDVERIEIVKGPSSALYGSDAMGGVIHIITRRPSDGAEAGVSLRGGSLGAHGAGGPLDRFDATADVSVSGEGHAHRVSGGVHTISAWDLEPADVATTASAVQQGDLGYRLALTPSADTELDATVDYMQRRLDGVDANDTGAVLDRAQIVEDVRAGVTGWLTPNAHRRVSVRLGAGWYRDQAIADQRRATSLDTADDNVEQSVEAGVQTDRHYDRLLGGSHLVTAGVDGLVARISGDRVVDESADRQRFAVFLTDLWSLGAEESTQVKLSPGLRADVDSQFGVAVTPRLATSLHTGALTGRLGAGTGFRAPDFRELFLRFENPGVGYVVSGTTELQPERSRSVNGGIELADTDASVAASAYFNDITDLIQIGSIDREPGALQVFEYENIARAQTAGGEVQGVVSPDPVHFELAYAYTWTRDLDLGEPLENRVPHRVTAVAAVDLPQDIAVRAQAGLSSPRTPFLDQGIARPVDAGWLLTADLRAAWTLDVVELHLGVDNVFDAVGDALSPVLPRFFHAGVSTRFGGEKS